jgi:putative ABC transport system permease protein
MHVVYIVLALLLLVVVFGPLLYWDKGRRYLVLALRSLRLHKMRTFLSVLGIIIGTLAVIVLMAFGEGSMQEALNDIRKLGATNIIVSSRKPPENSATSGRARVAIYGLTQADYDRFAILQQGGTVTRMVPMRIFPQEMRRSYYVFTGQVVGTTAAYAEVNDLPLALGRFLRPEDEEKVDTVVVLGSRVAEALFPFDDPLGKTLTLGQSVTNTEYKIVGVLKNRASVADKGGGMAQDYNNDVYIPLNTCNNYFGSTITYRQAGSMQREQVELSQITLTVSDIDKVRSTGKWIESILADHPKADWTVAVPLDKLEHAEREQMRFMILLAVIGGISLVVGGIGIMNIMLATVTERTREIGIRRALGAKRRDIIWQFLIEAVVQTSLGGVLGMLGGLCFVVIAPPIAEWFANYRPPAQVTAVPIVLSIVVAVGTGVAFGLYPAYRAAMLDPIEALRHE